MFYGNIQASLINIANKDLLIESSLNEIDDMNISELYYEASHTLHGITLKIIDAKYEPEVYAMFIRITQRGSDKFENELIFAYDRLGHFFHHYFEEIDYAIDLYSKAIDLNPERPDPDTLEARGDCFSMKNDYKNALNDYKKALEMDGEYNSYLANIIEEFERMI